MKDLFVKTCKDASLTGAVMLVYNKGKIVEKHKYGYASLEEKRKANENTVFRIASISKVIVALCAMRLYQEGKIKLDADISDYLGFNLRNPKHPNVPITVKMLMTQTSSISDGKEKGVNADYDSGYNLINGTDEECGLYDLLSPQGARYVKETYNNHRPGTFFEYSNFGCGILACIIEKVTGINFTDYAQKIIFKPLKLDASFIVTDIKSKDIASTYEYVGGTPKLVRSKEMFADAVYKKFRLGENFRGPAGGLFISMKDLLKIQETLLHGGMPIINQQTLNKMLEMQFLRRKIPFESYVAKGLQLEILDDFQGRRLWGHFGGAYGVRSLFFFNKQEQFGIVFITNGGIYKETESGIIVPHYNLIAGALNKYWHPDIASTFMFHIGDPYGYLLDRRIDLDYKIEKQGIIFSKLSLFDALGLNVIEDYDYLTKEGRRMTLSEVLDYYRDKYAFDVLKNEATYMISYKRK